MALKSSDSIVAAADDDDGDEVDAVGDDELAIFELFSSFSVNFLITPQDGFQNIQIQGADNCFANNWWFLSQVWIK